MSVTLRLFALTALAMTAFAANSVLARLAMATGEAGPWTFTALRILSGALVLVLLAGPRQAIGHGSWLSALALLGYAGAFSYAYLSLQAGTGALILFALVQITMIGWGYVLGERLRLLQWAGLFMAVAGLVWLLLPGLGAPPLIGAGLMALSGISWGVYSLRGRGQSAPTASTAGNFARAAILALPITLAVFFIHPEASPSLEGAVYAIISGAVTSGLGYAIWYAALRGLTASLAGIAQLTVPALAAAGGLTFLAEPLTLRFLMATTAILAGVALASLSARRRKV
ncbi:DMT family transporter [Henriciella litoralis]|uniref:DMT family transporter n=1 Tax=Henriciella litoralis TaxID=568102 RepID=UPI000A056BF4|nr:DMT family transporter [Henriciella litoralis]